MYRIIVNFLPSKRKLDKNESNNLLLFRNVYNLYEKGKYTHLQEPAVYDTKYSVFAGIFYNYILIAEKSGSC